MIAHQQQHMCTQSRGAAPPPTENSVGTIVKASFVKESAKVKCGLSIARRRSGHFVVTKVLAGSLAAATPLKKGMLVHTINKIKLANLTSKAAARILIKAKGRVTILATVRHTACDPKKTPRLPVDKRTAGITWTRRSKQNGVYCSRYEARLVEDPTSGYVAISHIIHGSHLENTRIHADMTILKIDNQSCKGMNPLQVALKLDSILTRTPVIIGLPDGTPFCKLVCTKTGHIVSYQ